MQKKKKPFYGWAIAGSGALGNALQGGLIFWSMGLYAAALEDVLNESRARITIVETCVSVAVNLMYPFAGVWVDKRSARHLVAVGTLSMGAGLCLISVAGSIVSVWIVFATLIPLGVLAVGVLPSSALISRWFKKRRGLALGISVAGSSVGGFLAPPAVAYLLTAYGWRVALLVIGVSVMALAPVFYIVVANHPEDRGCQRLEEEEAVVDEPSSLGEPEWTVFDLLRTPATYLQAIVSGSLLGITLAMLANLGFHAKDLGLSTQQTASLLSLIAAFSFGSKIVFGIIIDRWGVKVAAYLTMLVMAAAMLSFLIASKYVAVLAAAIVLGCAIGGVTPVWTSLIAAGFGAASFGRAIGLQNPMHIPITAPIAPLAGYVSDTTGSYQGVFIGFLCLLVVAALALSRLQLPVVRRLQ